jgi:hypothetical protein
MVIAEEQGLLRHLGNLCREGDSAVSDDEEKAGRTRSILSLSAFLLIIVVTCY